MRGIWLAGVAAALLSAAPAHAQVGLCNTVQGPCASLATQTAQLDIETVTQVREIWSALSLGATSFRDLFFDVQNILNIINTANMLVGLTGQMITNISSQGGYPNISNWQQSMTNESLAVGNAFKVCGQVTNVLQSISNDVGQLEILVSQVMVAIGRQQSLQTISSQLSQVGQSIQKVETGAIACRQGFATYDTAQEDRAYLSRSVSNHDLEQSWLSNCAALARLGGPTPPACQ